MAVKTAMTTMNPAMIAPIFSFMTSAPHPLGCLGGQLRHRHRLPEAPGLTTVLMRSLMAGRDDFNRQMKRDDVLFVRRAIPGAADVHVMISGGFYQAYADLVPVFDEVGVRATIRATDEFRHTRGNCRPFPDCIGVYRRARCAGLHTVKVRNGKGQRGFAKRELVDVQSVFTATDLKCLFKTVDVQNKWLSRRALIAILQICPFPHPGSKGSRAVDNSRGI